MTDPPDPIDLDANATTPIAPEVLDAMAPHWRAGGNAESRHALGRAARRAWDRAREQVAAALGADPTELTFTSGGTEANNLAIFGSIQETPAEAHVITSPIEHPAVAGPIAQLQSLGVGVSTPTIAASGVMSISDYESALQSNTRLLTLMLANNETGAIQPVRALAELANELRIPLHTDAVQAVGRIPVNFRDLGVTTLAASAHKLHGPCGIGALLLRRGSALSPRMFGGSQQSVLRPGTPPVALAVGMATALELWQRRQIEQTQRWRELRVRLEQLIRQGVAPTSVICHGPAEESLRLPQTLNLGFPGLDANALLMQLDLAGVCASIGSACASGSTQPSPTLAAMNVPANTLRSSIRLSLNSLSTESQVDDAAQRIIGIIKRMTANTGD